MPKKPPAGNFLTRKIGPFPGYVWGLGAAGVGLIYFYMVGRQGGSAGAAGSTPASLAASPAASSIPYVPSVTVTGLPPNTAAGTAQPAGNPMANTLQLVSQQNTPAPWNPSGVPVWNQGRVGASIVATLPFNSSVQVTGPPQQSGQKFFYPVGLPGGGTGYIQNDYVSGFGSGGGPDGAGGPGVSGLGSPLVTSMMGWTSGWSRQTAGWPLAQTQAVMQAGRGDVMGGAGDAPQSSADGSGGSGAVSGVKVARFGGKVRNQGRIRLQRRIGSRTAG